MPSVPETTHPWAHPFGPMLSGVRRASGDRRSAPEGAAGTSDRAPAGQAARAVISFDETASLRCFLIREDRHRGAHPAEAELLVEALSPWIGIEDDLLVPG